MQTQKRTFVELDGSSHVIAAREIEKPYVTQVVDGVATDVPPSWDDLDALPAGVIEVSDVVDRPGVATLIGYSYDVNARTFTAPPARLSSVSRLQFEQLFTQSERIAIRKRRATADTTADVIDDFYDLLDKAGEVDLGDATVAAGLGFLVAQGLLTQARADAIKANTAP